MREIMIALGQNPAGMCLAVWTGLAIFSFVIWYGFYMVTLAGVSLVSGGERMLTVRRQKTIKTHQGYAYGLIPRLGYTMADGGNMIEKEKPLKKE